MNLNTIRVEDMITIEIEGRVDTNTSPMLQKEILLNFQKTTKLILDFEKTVYVSSAGLRALLIGEKTAQSKQGTMILRHVPKAVMNVLEMSGFAKILKIES